MINAGTVGAYLTLDISDYENNLATAGQMLESFRRGASSGGLGEFIGGSVEAAFHSAGTAALRFASDYSGASEKIHGYSLRVREAFSGVGKSLGGIRDNAVSAFSGAAEQIRRFGENAGGAIGKFGGRLREFCDRGASALRAFADEHSSASGRITGSVRNLVGGIRSVFAKVPESGRNAFRQCRSLMKAELDAAAPGLFSSAANIGSSVIRGLKGILLGSGGAIAVGAGAAASLRKGLESGRASLNSAMRSVMQGMLSAAGSVNFTGIGGNIVGGIIRGINSKKPSLITTASNLAAGAAAAARRALGINSPSRVMMEVGKFTAEGMELGLKQGSRGIYRTASAISDEAAAALGSISTRGLNLSGVHSTNYGDRLDRLLDAVEKLADSRTTMEIDGRPFGRLVREARSGAALR